MRKNKVNVGKSKVMRCSMYGNGGPMHGDTKLRTVLESDCFKYLGSQVAADVGCEIDVVFRMNEGIKRGEL